MVVLDSTPVTSGAPFGWGSTEQTRRTAYNAGLSADFPTAVAGQIYAPAGPADYADYLVKVSTISGLTYQDGAHLDDPSQILIAAAVAPTCDLTVA